MSGQNLVLNPGFETGNFTDWSITDPEPNDPDIGVDSQPLDVNSGSFGVFAGNETSTLSQTISTLAGHTYSVSFHLDVYQSQAFNGGLTVTFGGQTVENLVEPAETDQFVRYTASIHVASTSSPLKFTFTDPGGYFGLDDVSVIETAACYLRGTRLFAERGEIEIENLSVGDRLKIASGAFEEIRWIGHRSYSGRFFAGRPDLAPIRIRAGALGENTPKRDLLVSPRHAMLLDGALVPAQALVNGVSILREIGLAEIEYFHVELAEHRAIFAEGALSESFVDDDSRMLFHNAHEYFRLHPDAARKPAVYCAPCVTDGYALAAIRERIDLLAGLRAKPTETQPRGQIDRVGSACIEGWAQNIDFPEAPVCLDIVSDGRIVAQTLANRFRADLAAAGIGEGRHAFSVRLPSALTDAQRRSLEVRRSSDGAPLTRATPAPIDGAATSWRAA